MDMKEIGIDRNSALEALQPTVVSFLNQLEPQKVHAQPGPLGGIGYIQYDPSELWKVHEISEVFGIPSVPWLQEIERRQKENVQYALEMNDPVTAVEVREEYIQILLKQDRVEKALLQALSITDGIDLSEVEEPNPADYRPGSDEAFAALIQWSGKRIGVMSINQIRGRVIEDIAIYLIKQGKMKEAEDVLTDTGTDTLSFGVLDALLTHYRDIDDVQAVHELMGTIERTLEEKQPEDFDSRFIRGIRNRCLKYLAIKALESDDERKALEYAEKISVPAAKRAWYEEYLKRLTGRGETRETMRIVNRMLQILNEETEWEAEDADVDESVGTIELRGDRKERKYFDLPHRADKLMELAEQLLEPEGFSDVIDRLIDGSGEEGTDGIIYAIDHSSADGQVYLRGRLMKLFAARGDWKRMDEEYHEALRRHPESQDSINAVLAEILSSQEPEQAKEIILSLADPKKKCQALSEFFVTCLQRGTLDVSEWRIYTREIEMIEDAIRIGGELNVDFAKLLDADGKEEDIPEENEPSLATIAHFGSWAFGMVPPVEASFWRISPSFISSAATIAFQKGRYEVLKDVISDARVDLNSKIRILHDVSVMVRDGEET